MALLLLLLNTGKQLSILLFTFKCQLIKILLFRDRSSSWTYYLDTDPVSGVVVEKPVTIMSYPDGESEFKARNKQVSIIVVALCCFYRILLFIFSCTNE